MDLTISQQCIEELYRVGFCRSWNIFVQLGATDDSYIMEGSENMTYRDF